MAIETLTTGIARVEVTIDGTPLPSDAYRDLTNVDVHDDLEVPSMFSLRLTSLKNGSVEDSWADDKLFALGGVVEISLGHGDKLELVITGEITGLDLELEAGNVPAVVVRGYDMRHRMLRGTKTRSYVEMTDSDIASKIASDQGLSVESIDSKVKHAYVLQHAQSDLEFLRDRALAIGYEVLVKSETLHFRPIGTDEQPTLVLAADRDLLEFFPRMTTRDQVGSVEVRGWDPKEKRTILGKAKAGENTLTNPDAGAKLSDEAFGDSVVSEVRLPISSQDEADLYALKQLEEFAATFVTADGLCFGRPDLRAGRILDIQKIGKRFSGKYNVASALHAYASKSGYRTSFAAKKDAT